MKTSARETILLEALKEIRYAINKGRLKWDFGDGPKERKSVGPHDTLCYLGWVAYEAISKAEGLE